MIKFIIDNGHLKEFKIDGELFIISAEMSVLPKLIYQELSKDDAQAAEIFKKITKIGVGNEDSPVWNNDMPLCDQSERGGDVKC